MKKIILPALVAVSALGLAACDSTADAPAATETEVVTEEVGTDPAMTEPVMEADGGDSVTISEDGVNADINDGDTSVTADIDGNPSMTVETN
ncbi:hypothetical protein [Croceicoccus sediminis]|uniref:hypothetical protein n=1 Tax=Croceicoccus sediminis TaxID=2571150 RepID=UPI001183DC7A|nr:hypothetical protein [Croceicoccus sediminis]